MLSLILKLISDIESLSFLELTRAQVLSSINFLEMTSFVVLSTPNIELHMFIQVKIMSSLLWDVLVDQS